MTRRIFLTEVGRGVTAALVVGLVAACTGAQDGGTRGDGTPDAGSGTLPDGWRRIGLGFVSAYVRVRAGEAVVVDTGTPGSEGAIAEGLAALGTGWTDVGTVLLTHRHPDHVGSLDAVLAAAPDAAVYAGAADIDAIASPRPLTPVVDGEVVADLRIVATPGHTPGHVCALDETARLLVAGDAIRGGDGGVIGPDPRFTEDMDEAARSVAKLAGLDYDAVVFGHGEPVLANGDRLVAELAAELTG